SIHRERPDFKALARELDRAESLRARVFRGMKELLSSRAARSAFSPAAAQRVLAPDGSGLLLPASPVGSASPRPPVTGGPIFALLRGAGGDATLAAVNVSGNEARCAIPKGFRPIGRPIGRPFDPAGLGPLREIEAGSLWLPPLGTAWLDGRMEGE
ncbi:MAG TPA: hypothetical protein VMV44_15690, partial [Rectinemataceae bacterium]|nr:hypothetical protein [Rectinemataceae bacterium]